MKLLFWYLHVTVLENVMQCDVHAANLIYLAQANATNKLWPNVVINRKLNPKLYSNVFFSLFVIQLLFYISQIFHIFMFFNSVISRIVLSFKFSNILNPTESLVGSRILLVQIWISWFVLVDIRILIYTGLNPVQFRIPISTSRNWNSNLY
jgi:hypothetical protein